MAKLVIELPQRGDLHLAQSAKRIPELDGLRGLAILLVVLCHYVARGEKTGHSAVVHHFFQAFSAGWSGVDLFFVLSGFLIGSILLESRGSRSYFRTFYLRRAHRILPFYYLWILLCLVGFTVAYFIAPSAMVTSADFRPIPRYIVFIQNFFWSKTYFEMLFLGATWSLAVEEQFYLCAPLLVRYVSGRALFRVLIAVVLLSPLLRFLMFFFVPDYRYLITFAMPFRGDGLALGMIGALLWQRPGFRGYLQDHPETSRRVLLFLFALIAALVYWYLRPVGYVDAIIGYSALAFFFLGLLLFVLSYPDSWIAGATRLKPLRRLGTVSYCVYIIHYPVLYGLHKLLLHRRPRIDDGMGFVVTLLGAFATYAIAAISWRVLEKPLIRRGHQFVY
jgi:peptidoglycan/LPS O-acetylase OafA/YrhL